MNERLCECEDFKTGMPQIINAQVMASPETHSWGIAYTGKPFYFCPWCGRELKKIGSDLSIDQYKFV